MSTRLTQKYITSAQTVLKTVKIHTDPLTINPETTQKVIDHAKAYLEDSKYYLQKRRTSISLTSIAYCEGILDALRLTGAAHFEWPKRNEQKPRK